MKKKANDAQRAYLFTISATKCNLKIHSKACNFNTLGVASLADEIERHDSFQVISYIKSKNQASYLISFSKKILPNAVFPKICNILKAFYETDIIVN